MSGGLSFMQKRVVEMRGLEPLTPCMPCKCSSQLSYIPTVESGIIVMSFYFEVEIFWEGILAFRYSLC